jgi:trans-aconitate methyltransferase
MAQTWDPNAYAQNAGFVHGLAGGVMEWLAPQAGERILDLGCGDGQLTERLAE